MLGTFQIQLYVYAWWELHFGYFKTNTQGIGGLTLGVTEGQLLVVILCLGGLAFGPGIYSASLASLLPQYSYFSGLRSVLITFKCDQLSVAIAIWIPFCLNITKMAINDVRSCLSGVPKDVKMLAAAQISMAIGHVVIQYRFYSFEWARDHPAMACVIITSYSCILALRMHLSAVCRVEFHPVQWPLIPFYMGIIVISLVGEQTVYGRAALVCMGFWGTAYLLDFIVTTIGDITLHLGIPCFTVSRMKK